MQVLVGVPHDEGLLLTKRPVDVRDASCKAGRYNQTSVDKGAPTLECHSIPIQTMLRRSLQSYKQYKR
eukprot:4740180-Amphidinium_carterae.1